MIKIDSKIIIIIIDSIVSMKTDRETKISKLQKNTSQNLITSHYSMDLTSNIL